MIAIILENIIVRLVIVIFANGEAHFNNLKELHLQETGFWGN